MKTQLMSKNSSRSDSVAETIGLGVVGFVAGYATGKLLSLNPFATGAVGSFLGGVMGAGGSYTFRDFR